MGLNEIATLNEVKDLLLVCKDDLKGIEELDDLRTYIDIALDEARKKQREVLNNE